MRWFGIGVPALVVIGLGIAVGLHVGLHRTWSELGFPISAYVTIQVAVYVFMFWARMRARTRNEYGPAIVLVGLYGWGAGLLIIYYGTKWGLLANHSSDDLIVFTLFMAVVVAVTFGFFSVFKGRLKSNG
jgi:hypothetical protein